MIICFDLETTGLDKYNDKIIEVAMVKFDEKTFRVVDTFSTLVNPQMIIPDVITNITNISNEDVSGAPVFEDLVKNIKNFIGDTPLLGHNVFFDIDFFVNNGVDIKQNYVIDTFFLANILAFDEPSLNLEMLCNSYGIGFSGAHRALNDVNATISLFSKLVEKFNNLSQQDKHLLYYVFNKSEDKNIEYLKEKLFNNIDSNLIFDDFEKRILKIVRRFDNNQEIKVNEKLDYDNIINIFDNLGSNVEKRENQQKMTKLVMNSFLEKKKVVIEAPTGLGKTFAYLIPSIIHSVKNQEKVYISTKTKTLQDQLYFKDLIYLKQNLGIDFSYTKLKGKRNYLSIKLFFDQFFENEITYTKVGFLSKIILWLHKTSYGELDELNFFGQEYLFLKYVNADNFEVLTDKNPHRDYEYLYKARSKLEVSNIIVINHSLLFSDLNSESSILGKVTNLIIDEGHNIEDSVTDSLKQKYTLGNLVEIFDIIESILKKTQSKTLDFIRYKSDLISRLELLDDYGFNYINLKVIESQKFKQTLLKQDFFNNIELGNLLKKIELNFIDIMDNLSVCPNYDFTKEIASIQNLYNLLKIILDINSDKTYIKIVNYDDNYGVSFEYTLLNPGEYLSKNLWNNLKTCILTSATLQIGGNIDYFKKLLFLDDFDFFYFESDFDYKKQATLFIPTDIGDIKYNSEDIVKFLGRFYEIVRGKVLTLLTNYTIIKKIYTSLNSDLKKQGINLYAQSIAGSKVKLLNFFLANPQNSILLGTDSFWEGVDIPGDDLKYLVIHKFPFSVPSDPIFQARSIFFKDPFLDYGVPKAIIKLKQGFGRLIRTKNDNGVVILLDNRILSSNWGNMFYEAFPKEINIKKGSINSFLDILKNVK